MLKALARIAYRGTERLTAIRPLNLALGLFSYSLFLLMLSAMVDTWEATRTVGEQVQQVGYGDAVNWAWGFTLLCPFFAFFLLRASQAADRLPNRMAAVGMLAGEDGKPHPRAAQLAAARWTAAKKNNAPWWLMITTVGVLVSLWEWTAYSFLPLATGRQPREDEIDWSTKFFTEPEVMPRLLNGGFSFLAFIQQIFLVSLLGLVIYLILSVAAFISDLRSSKKTVHLTPSLARCGQDSRLGFECFVPLFESLLLAVLLAYIHLFLSRLWNAFLNPAEEEQIFGTAWTMIKEPFHEGLSAANPGDQIIDRTVEYLGALGAMNFSGLVVSLGALVLITLCLVFLIFVMRHSARESRDELLLGSSGKRRECLESMSLWPLKYPRLDVLVALAVLAGLSIVVYRVGVWGAGAVLALALPWAVVNVMKSDAGG